MEQSAPATAPADPLRAHHRQGELPLVSVIIPVYNAGKYLAECLDSVLSQQYPHIEVITIDDGSNDDSLSILRGYGDRIRIHQTRRAGPAGARNAGLRLARGELIAFQDADDLWLAGKLERQVAHLLAHPEHGIVFTQFAFWNALADGRFPDPASLIADPERWEIRQPLSGWIYAEQLEESCIGMHTPLLRREVIDAIGGFDESLLAGSDYDFWLKATYRFQAHKIADCLALYRIHDSGVTGRPKRENFAARLYQRALDTQGTKGPDGRGPSAEAIARRLSGFWIGFGLQHIERGELALGIRSMGRFIATSPNKPDALRRSLTSTLRALARRRAQK
jgi:glycosyltransferase involved in cell wall biosynthesis